MTDLTNRQLWHGSAISECQICGEPIVDSFVDGVTSMGPWAIMCLCCHGNIGCGLGTGKGQKYQRDETEESPVFVKVEG